MCGQLARAWGNARFGAVTPAEEVCLAAEQHDTSWAEWELAPTLDPRIGLPHTFKTAHFTVHLAIHAEWPPKLVAQSRYAALLVSMHHSSFFDSPGWLGQLRADGRKIKAFVDQAALFQERLSATLDASGAEIERNHRLVRTWDGLSHDLILNQAPTVRRNVPAAGDTRVDMQVEGRDGSFTLDPWPFATDRVVVRTEGRLLEGTFLDEGAMRRALDRAAWIELDYELAPSSGSD